jgi:asparagine synthase (glutamine-hydrolysing)
MFIPRIIYSMARRQGVRALLDGVDGDLVASYNSFYLSHFLRAGKWKLASQVLFALSKELELPPSVVLRQGLRPLLPLGLQALYRQLRKRQAEASEERDSTISQEFARRIGLAERRKVLQESRMPLARTPREAHTRTLTWGHIPWALGGKYDRAAANFSIEPRHPFFDKRLVELCLALPAEQRWDRGWTKVILRRAMAGILPEEVRWRTAPDNLAWDFMRPLLDCKKKIIAEVMHSDLDELSTYVDLVALRRAYEHYVSGKTEEVSVVWHSVSLVLWLRRMKPTA